jgi:hypothetical protein
VLKGTSARVSELEFRGACRGDVRQYPRFSVAEVGMYIACPFLLQSSKGRYNRQRKREQRADNARMLYLRQPNTTHLFLESASARYFAPSTPRLLLDRLSDTKDLVWEVAGELESD